MLFFQDCSVGCSFFYSFFYGRGTGCRHGFRLPANPLRSSDNCIDDAGAAAICTTLEQNTTLQSLDLSGECMHVKRFFAYSCLIGCEQDECVYFKRLYFLLCVGESGE